MVERNKNTSDPFFPTIDRIVKEYEDSSYVPLNLVSRRQFLAGSLLGTAFLTISPVSNALVLPPAKFNWELLIRIGTAIATILGYGPLAENVLRMLRCNGDLITNVGGMIQKGFIDPCSIPADVPKVGGVEPEGGPANHYTAQQPNRFWVMAPNQDRYNGLGLFYNVQKSKEPTGRLSLPTLMYVQNVPRRLRTLGYATKDILRQALVPDEQTRAAEGRFQQSYTEPDKYKSRDNGEFEYFWETAGRGVGTLNWSGRLRNQNTGRMVTLRDTRATLRYEANLVR